MLTAEVKSDVQDLSATLDADARAKFRRIVGKIMYTTNVRPYVAFVVEELARHLAKPTVADWE
eukprot:1486199-Heterocapsa_arctica.AAC.1